MLGAAKAATTQMAAFHRASREGYPVKYLCRQAVKRPIAVLMTLVMVVLLGLVAYPRIAVDLLPDVSFPGAAVVVQWTGAAPQEVESLLTRPLEEALGTVPRVKRISSMSFEDRASIVVDFLWGTDMDRALVEMRERIDLVRPYLPRDATSPLVVKFDPALLPIMAVGVAADDARATAAAVDDVVRRRLERIEGVAAVSVVGKLDEEFVAYVDPVKLQRAGLTWPGLIASLRGIDLSLPGGRIVEDELEYLLRSKGATLTSDGVGYIALSSGGAAVAAMAGGGAGSAGQGGGIEIDLTEAVTSAMPWLGRLQASQQEPVRLGDVARIVREPADPRGLSRLNGRPSVNLAIHKTSQSNTLAVARRVQAELAAIERESRGRIHTEVTMNQAEFIERAIADVRENLVLGSILAVLVLFLFLRNLAGVLVIAVAVPVSMIATLLLVYLGGYSLNLMTLSGLAVGAGMLVDNSIVVFESIYQRVERGEAPLRAAVRGAAEVAGAVAGSTATTLAVFFPVVFVGGVSGLLFREFALTLGASLLASLAVSLTVVPSAAGVLLRRRAPIPGAGAPIRLRRAYESVLRRCLRRPGAVLLGTIGFAGAVVAPWRSLGAEFLPRADVAQLVVRLSMPAGTPLRRTEAVLRRVEEIAASLPDVRSYALSIGVDGPFVGSLGGGVDQGELMVRLRPARERTRTSDRLIDDLRAHLSQIPASSFTVEATDGLIGDGLGAPLEVLVHGDDHALLERLAARAADRIRDVPGVAEVAVGVREGRPEVALEYRGRALAERGLHPAAVGMALRAGVQGERVSSVLVEGRQLPLRVQLEPEARDGVAALGRLSFADPFGQTARLGELAEIRREVGPAVIQRRGGQRFVPIRLQTHGRDLRSVAEEVQARLASFPLPPGYQIEYGGQAREMSEATQLLGLALTLAVVLVFMVMAAQFESLALPLVVMLCIPLAAGGAVLMLKLFGLALSVPAVIGAIVLTGVAVTNGIVLVDCWNRLRRAGITPAAAAFQAATTRLRPVLMTSLTTLLGLIPLMFARGEGSEFGRPLAVSLFGGMLVGTVLTLIAIPCGAVLMHAGSAALARRLRWKVES